MSLRAQIRLVLFLVLALPRATLAEVTVEVENIPNGLNFWANNPDPWPVTATVTGQFTNMSPARELPYTLVLPAGSRKNVVTFRRGDPQAAYRADVRVKSRPGSLRARPDPKARYRLPFSSGEGYRVSQAFRGEISHTGPFEFAVDFMMPVGATVCAARDGLVVKVENDFKEGAWDPALLLKANVINILHDDGTVGAYCHLKYRGAKVTSGQRVSAGDPIGISGRTGMIRDPHLHFHVEIPIDADTFRSVPFKFEGPKRGGIVPEKDATYTAP